MNLSHANRWLDDYTKNTNLHKEWKEMKWVKGMEKSTKTDVECANKWILMWCRWIFQASTIESSINANQLSFSVSRIFNGDHVISLTCATKPTIKSLLFEFFEFAKCHSKKFTSCRSELRNYQFIYDAMNVRLSDNLTWQQNFHDATLQRH